MTIKSWKVFSFNNILNFYISSIILLFLFFLSVFEFRLFPRTISLPKHQINTCQSIISSTKDTAIAQTYLEDICERFNANDLFVTSDIFIEYTDSQDYFMVKAGFLPSNIGYTGYYSSNSITIYSATGLKIDQELYGLIVHESLHNIQMNFYKEPSITIIPKWYLEGQAEYYRYKLTNQENVRYVEINATLENPAKDLTTLSNSFNTEIVDTETVKSYNTAFLFYSSLVNKYGTTTIELPQNIPSNTTFYESVLTNFSIDLIQEYQAFITEFQ